ncbi:MAG: hypothetical protein RI906_2012 [Pseudomonadota bacterium]|jgi:hypothetical protein
MATELKLDRTGAQTYTFNESRLQKVLTAQTLNEAQRMGLWDRIKDWRADGVKAEAIRSLYMSVADPQQHETQPITLLHRFERLKSLIADDREDQFVIQVTGGISEGQSTWSFSLSIAGTPLYRSEDLNDPSPHQSSIDFKHHQAVYELTDTLIKTTQDALAHQADNALLPDRLTEHIQVFLGGLREAFARFVEVGDNETAESAALRRVIELRNDGNPVLRRLEEMEVGDSHLLALVWPEDAERTETLARFERARETLDAVGDSTITSKQFKDSVEEIASRSSDEFVKQSLATVSDNADTRTYIRAHLDDELFGSKCFKEIIGGKTSGEFPTFKAVFERDGMRVELELSNRPGTNGELRGESLQTLLQEGNYRNLRELILLPFGTPNDDQIFYFAWGFAQTLSAKFGFASTDLVKTFLVDLREHGSKDLQAEQFAKLYNVKLSKTNLLEMLMREETPSKYRSPKSADPDDPRIQPVYS